MNNPVGIISMQFVRPFLSKDLSLFGHIRELGFDFIELLVPEPEDQLNLHEVRLALADSGLGVVLAARVNMQRSIASENAAARQGGIDYLRYCIDSAAQLGATIVGGPLYGEPLVFAGRAPTPADDAQIARRLEATVSALRQVAPQAADGGVALALEPLNRFETDIVCSVAQGIEVVDAVDHPALGLLLDTFHMNMEESSLPGAIRAAGSRIVHFQANENHRGFPGTGHVNWAEVMRALHDVDYRGPVSLEPFRRDDWRVGLPIAHWRAPHEDESEKLRAGLALVKSSLTFAGVAG